MADVELPMTSVAFMGLPHVSLHELQTLAQLSPYDLDVLDKLRGVLGMRRAVVLLTFVDQNCRAEGDDLRQICRQARAALRANSNRK
ncbi:hypothetical protein ACQKP1_22450 [Allorhizobium sp. NPDC080224]|uniref:hypothetical protein n=1 Tax=Allorhizobium sp. NPDC080224 TaxID=3390547 RepID=UPI003D075718